MIDRKTLTEEYIESLPLYSLRLLLRELGGTPGNKSVKELRDEILAIKDGKVVPKPTNRGRKPKNKTENPKTFNDNEPVDVELVEEEPGTAPKKRGYGAYSEYKPEDIEADNNPRISLPGLVQVADIDAEDPIRYFPVCGTLVIHPDGYGFLKEFKYGERKKDVYVHRNIIRAYELKVGDQVEGTAINRKQGNVAYTLSEVMFINGISREDFDRKYNFDDNLKAVYPQGNLISDKEEDKTLRALDIIAPIGRGQRALIVAPPKTGKTTLLKKFANAFTQTKELSVIVLLIDERPEEVGDFIQNISKAEIYASTFDQNPEKHIHLAEIVFEHAKRYVESGKDVVLLLDSITKLTRAYNTVLPSSGKTLSGGLESQALIHAKKLFGSARKFANGGSLTIISTALVETGSRMDEIIFEEFRGTGNSDIVLSRELAQKRIFPAIDLYQTGTRKEELLLSEEKLSASYKIRKLLTVKDNATEIFLEMLSLSKNNDDLLRKLDGWLKAIFS